MNTLPHILAQLVTSEAAAAAAATDRSRVVAVGINPPAPATAPDAGSAGSLAPSPTLPSLSSVVPTLNVLCTVAASLLGSALPEDFLESDLAAVVRPSRYPSSGYADHLHEVRTDIVAALIRYGVPACVSAARWARLELAAATERASAETPVATEAGAAATKAVRASHTAIIRRAGDLMRLTGCLVEFCEVGPETWNPEWTTAMRNSLVAAAPGAVAELVLETTEAVGDCGAQVSWQRLSLARSLWHAQRYVCTQTRHSHPGICRQCGAHSTSPGMRRCSSR